MNRTEIWKTLETKILPLVQKPGRYIGGELNEVHKEPDSVDVRLALIFPDVYEIGMSNLGLKMLYEIVNQVPKFYAERVFSPWIDMEEYMRRYNVPLFSLETHSPVREFDILGFSFQYELCYTNVLNILNLSGIPMRTEERMSGNYPLVIAGGPCAYVPEPMAPFIDVFVIGDGEEIIIEILEFYRRKKEKNKGNFNKKQFLKELPDNISGVYVPTHQKQSEGSFWCGGVPSNGVPYKIKKRVVKDLNRSCLPTSPVVPLIGIVHDRITLEIMRGCPRRCRFCQAVVLYRPVRKRSCSELIDKARKCIRNTGYETVSLSSLSSTDFSGIEELVNDLLKEWTERKVSVSLPSMRVDSFNLSLVNQISRVKKTGITLAPEAASDKLLKVINKGYKASDVIDIAQKAYNMGYRLIKLYFMIGLPREDYSDLDGIIDTLNQLSRLGELNVSINTMIPKAHTPFQWLPMLSIEEIRNRQKYIRDRIRSRRVKLKFHQPELSILEAVFSRGDRRLSLVLHKAWELGAKFDQWTECFRYPLWEKAFRDCGIKMNDYLESRDYNQYLAWDCVDTGLCKDFLIEESQKALTMSWSLN